MKQTVSLIEVDCLTYVSRYNSVVFTYLLHAIHLYGEQHGDSILAQPSRERDSFGRAPAVAINNDARHALFPIGQLSVAIGVQHLENFAVGLATLAILKHLHLNMRGILLSQMSCQLDFLMNGIVTPDESPYESNDDDSRGGQWGGAFGAARGRMSNTKDEDTGG